MDRRALFDITYGLFIAGVESEGRKNACITNTAIQVTSEPAGVTVTLLKTNLTTQMILRKMSFTVSILSRDCPLNFIRDFGLRSGRTCDKLEGMAYETDQKGNPYFSENTLSYISLNVNSVIDLGTHCLLVCSVTEAQKTGEGEPMTYDGYRRLKAGETPAKEGGGPRTGTYVCSVCHYVYDGAAPFEKLPDDYACPVCKAPKSAFVAG